MTIWPRVVGGATTNRMTLVDFTNIPGWNSRFRKTSLQSKTDAIAVMTLLKTMTVRTVLISKDNNDFHDILETLVTKWTYCGKMTLYHIDFLLHNLWEDMELNNIYHKRLDCEEMNLLWLCITFTLIGESFLIKCIV